MRSYLESEASGAISVEVPEGSSILAQVLTLEPDLMLTSLRDTVFETTSAYSLAVRLGTALTTTLRIFNPADRQVEICIFSTFGDRGHTYPIKQLAPHEVVEIDFSEARSERIAGEMGRRIPVNADVGQTQVVLHERDVDKKLVVLGTFDDLSSGNQVTAQGCTTCPPLLGGVSISPGEFEGVVGGEETFKVLAGFDNGGVKIVTALSQSSTSDPSVATVSSGTLSCEGVGIATLNAQYTDCVESTFTEPGTFGEEPECICSAEGTFGDTAPVASHQCLHKGLPNNGSLAGDENLPDTGSGYYHFLGQGDAPNTDDWACGNWTILKIQQIGEDWNHPARIGIGDISRQGGGSFPPHSFHQNGLEIDVRYVRSDDVEGPYNFTMSPSLYDATKTQELVNAFLSKGAVKVYVDSRAGLAGQGVETASGHHDHFHVRFSDPDGINN